MTLQKKMETKFKSGGGGAGAYSLRRPFGVQTYYAESIILKCVFKKVQVIGCLLIRQGSV